MVVEALASRTCSLPLVDRNNDFHAPRVRCDTSLIHIEHERRIVPANERLEDRFSDADLLLRFSLRWFDAYFDSGEPIVEISERTCFYAVLI